MKKRIFHRGYTIENSSGDIHGWETTVKGTAINGTLTEIKKSIDWWLDMSTFVHPQQFSVKAPVKSNALSESYRGYTLRNDSGKPNEWYLLLNGQLLKGNNTSIKQYLDKALQR